ncbi:MAG: M48 family metalloprotease [Treponema sp.]|jgi:hypothetical protein|nr:M48 family metalloprotease [Treponema sp.]
MSSEQRKGNYLYIHLTLFSLFFSLVFCFCTTSGRTNITELENKGTLIGVTTPDWVRLYLEKGVSALQAQPEYNGKYCIVGEESGTNRQFVLAWADQASAQQRIGSLLRTNIANRYTAAVNADATTSGSMVTSLPASQYQQEIDNILAAVVNVSYSGAQREADWWSLRRRYDPDNKEIYTDEYTAYVLYTVPKAEMNRQIALALETSVRADSALYDITIALARDILLQGYDESELLDAAAITRTAADSYNPPGSPTALALGEISPFDEYSIGRDVAATILANYRLWNNSPGLTQYLNLICATLAINSPKPTLFNGYHVSIIDSPEINAFATPGGHILISRGLINAAPSEDALAAVIAHEIAHIQLRHGLRTIQTNRDAADWLAQFSQSGAAFIAEAINNGYSQTQEYDADIAALALLAATGYNPHGLIVMLRELQKIQPGIRGGFNSTHPSPTSRLVNAQIAAARYPQTADSRGATARQVRFNAAKN